VNGNGTVRAVAYVRRSTRDQAQSLERQRHEIERYAAANGVTIGEWYEDDGISGVEDAERPGFQRMITDAERREFDVILVHEISRFGRFDAFQSGSWLHRLKAARVKVQAIEGTVRDPYSVQGKLMLALEQDREESKKLSMRTLSGQRETATKGFRAGGKVPFGFARRRRRADGVCEIVPRVGRAKRDKAEIIELVPGDPVEVEAIQTMFKMARDGVGYRTIAQFLNDRGIPAPDSARRKTIATVAGRWTAGTIRALLLNPAYAGDAIWNVRSMPKFHRLENDQIVALDDFETNRFRVNSKVDWVVKRDAHPALVDRALFEAVQQRIRSHPSSTRGHFREYLLTGLIGCAHCGDILVGTTRTRRKMVAGAMKTYADPLYVCAGTLRAKGVCRQVGLPRDGFERAVLRIVDEELLRPEALARLEHHLRLALARRSTADASDGIAALEKRELELKNRIAEGARRILQVGDDLVPEVRTAIGELKDDLQRVRTTIEAKRRNATLAADGESHVRATLDQFKSMAAILRDPTFPLERRREILRRLLPMRDGARPIQVEIHPDAPRGWRRALKRVIVRCLTTRRPAKDERVVGFQVAGAVAFKAGQPDPLGWDVFEGLGESERRLAAEDFEAEPALVGAGTEGWE